MNKFSATSMLHKNRPFNLNHIVALLFILIIELKLHHGFLAKAKQDKVLGSIVATEKNELVALKMCQLLGMNCATPTDFTFSLTGFSLRGGVTDKHSGGFGLAFYEGKGVRAFHDCNPASESRLVQFLKEYPIKTLNMISHIRYATQGSSGCLENVHPFSRELWGIHWCFAHNGDVPMFSQKNKRHAHTIGGSNVQAFYNPVGETDSEATFCAILNALRSKFNTLPTLSILYLELQSLCQEIIDFDTKDTILNFLLMCGENILFAYSHPGKRPNSNTWNGLYYTIRKHPFSTARLIDADVSIDFSAKTTKQDCVVVISTTPLTSDEVWCEFQYDQLILFDSGMPFRNESECNVVEQRGHGLQSEVLPKYVYLGSNI